MLYTFDFKKVMAIVGVAPIQGFADGVGIEVDLEDDLYSDVTGADGDMSRSRRHGMASNVKLTLAQTSPSNDVLSAIMLLDITNNAGVVPFLLKDALGTSLIFSAFGYIKKPPAVQMGKEITNREWNLRLTGVDYFVGGNLAAFAP